MWEGRQECSPLLTTLRDCTVDHAVWQQVSDYGNRMSGKSQLPAHRQCHRTTEEEEERRGPQELEGDHLVIGIPKIMHDAGLAVSVIIMMTSTVDLHGSDAVVGE